MEGVTSLLLASLWIAPHLAALAVLTALSFRLCANLRFWLFVRQRGETPPSSIPRISVLIPARDEAESITACLTSLLAQRYPNCEIIVLDDGSTDGTSTIVDALAARDSRLTALHRTGEPPPGWNGKSYACQQLAHHATGDWLLFTDADTVHEPDSVALGVRQALALGVSLVSALPRQSVQTWSERILVSFIIDFIPLVTLDFAALWRGRPARIAANGQYMLIHAATYRAIGGHASVRGALVDDFALAGRLRDCGYTVALVDGASLLTCRMYHNFRQVWSGFAKNLLAALTMAPSGWRALWQAPLFAWLYACVFVLPFVHLLIGPERSLALVEIGWLLLLRGGVIWRLKRPPVELVTTPLAAWAVMALGMTSLYRRWRRAGVTWKGRTYSG